MATFESLRETPAFADLDDSLLDLSDDELRTILIDLCRRCCDALNESLSRGTSDSFVDDTNILAPMIHTLTDMIYGYDFTEPTDYDALFRAIDEGLIQDLTDLINAGNSYNPDTILNATIWNHINITREY